MVKASVSTVPEKKTLKTLPGGYVVLRRMSYGEKLYRQEMATKQVAEVDDKTNRMAGLDISILSRKVAEWEFANLITDHNLEHDDEASTPFVFARPNELDKLDPRVGDEINAYIADMNNFEVADQKGN